jgi:FtsH-binding integral membrane protein
MECLPKSKAEKRYVKRMLITMTVYLVLVFGATWAVRHAHVQGWLLYVCAVVPSLAILWLLYVVGLYLKEETDEFVRQKMVTSILWGTAVVLGLSAVSDFLRGYTGKGDLPGFTIFIVFWMVFALAQGIQSLRNRVDGDE